MQSSPVSAEMFDGEQGGLGHPTTPSPSRPSGEGRFEPVAPLDHHSTFIEELVDAEVDQLCVRAQPVKVDMGKLDASGIQAHELEGGACDMCSRSGAADETTNEGRLAGAKVAFEKKQVARPETLAEMLPGRFRFRW